MTEYVMEYDGWADGIPIGEYLKVRDAMHARKREEVVRCRDCRHSLLHGTECRHFAAYEPIEGGDEYEEETYSVKPDGFCSWGERRADA